MSMCSGRGSPWQTRPGSATRDLSSASRSVCAPKRDAAVSTRPRQLPSWQRSRVCDPTRTAVIPICQNPDSGFTTGAQTKGDENRAGSCPPTVTSPHSLAKYMANSRFTAWDDQRFSRLNSGSRVSPARPSPTTPSHGSFSKGTGDIDVAAMNDTSVHAPVSPWTHNVSSINLPMTCPSPRSVLMDTAIPGLRTPSGQVQFLTVLDSCGSNW
mmetsp:Transcript_23488/g.61768  ORF Transcript_23488/g.61768 Transcript_23488/m.61768 type:complete len:212 (-) Transcript_23488:354-989(-)